MFPLDILECYTNGVFTARSPLPCHGFMQRKLAVWRSRQLHNFPTNMKAVKFLLNTAWPSMIKWIWIQGLRFTEASLSPYLVSIN